MGWPAIIAAAGAAIKGGIGIYQQIQAKKKADANKRSDFNIEDEYFDNRDIAARLAQGGIDEASLDYYGDMAGRGLNTAASSILQGGGNINDINRAYDTYLQGTRSIAAKDSELRRENILNYLDKNSEIAKLKTQKWALNEYQPFLDTAEAAAREKEAGISNLVGAVQEGAAIAASEQQRKLYEDLLREQAGRGNSAVTFVPAPSGRTTYTEAGRKATYGDFASEFDNEPSLDRRVREMAEFVKPREVPDDMQGEFGQRLRDFLNSF